MVTIADIGEFGLIAAFAARLQRGESTLVGIGDDAAVLAVPDGRAVATMDLLVEGRHFRRDWSGPGDIGAKAAAQNLADVAAMGASPIALLAGLAVPAGESAAWVQDLVAGMAEECSTVGAAVVGGDLAGSGTVMIAITALGHLAGRAPVTRGGARPGDMLAIAGVLGHSAAGLALLAAGLAEPAGLLAAHRRPHPPYQAGPEAAALGATSMIDVSDGLVADVGHVARASGVLIDIDTSLLPRAEELAHAAAALGERRHGQPPGGEGQGPAGEGQGPAGEGQGPAGEGQGPAAHGQGPAGEGRGGPPAPLGWVLTGGEDHALAATFPPGTSLPGLWTVIGQVSEGRGVRVDGQTFPFPGGWTHFT